MSIRTTSSSVEVLCSTLSYLTGLSNSRNRYALTGVFLPQLHTISRGQVHLALEQDKFPFGNRFTDERRKSLPYHFHELLGIIRHELGILRERSSDPAKKSTQDDHSSSSSISTVTGSGTGCPSANQYSVETDD